MAVARLYRPRPPIEPVEHGPRPRYQPRMVRPSGGGLPVPLNDPGHHMRRGARLPLPPVGARVIAGRALGFAGRVGARAIPAVGVAILLYDLWDIAKDTDWFPAHPYQPAGWRFGGWTLHHGPYTEANYGWGPNYSAHDPFPVYQGCNHMMQSMGVQWVPQEFWNFPLATGGSFHWLVNRAVPPLVNGFQWYHSGYVRDATKPSWGYQAPGAPEVLARGPRPEPRNPNLDRQAWGPPKPAWPDPVPQQPPPEAVAIEQGSGPIPRPQYHRYQRPPAGVREVKTQSRAAKVGIFLWDVLDTIAELSEIGGSLYDALPLDVRKKWNCADGINIGQYGTDMNRCKADALWHNWHKLDTAEAIMNIAKNVAEDMTIGQFHKWLSKITPPGFSWQKTALTHLSSHLGPEAYIAARLKELFRFLGLED